MKENQENINENNNTIDYSQLYGNQNQNSTNADSPTTSVIPTIEAAPIILDEPEEHKEIVEDVIPAFDTSVLEDLPEDLKPKTPEEPLINSMLKESQQEKEQNKRNIMFIVILFAVLIFAVVVLFPMLIDV